LEAGFVRRTVRPGADWPCAGYPPVGVRRIAAEEEAAHVDWQLIDEGEAATEQDLAGSTQCGRRIVLLSWHDLE
jgi:hypothetical protein